MDQVRQQTPPDGGTPGRSAVWAAGIEAFRKRRRGWHQHEPLGGDLHELDAICDIFRNYTGN